MVRVELDSGRRLVGLRYPEPLITEVTGLIRQQKFNALTVCVVLYFGISQRYTDYYSCKYIHIWQYACTINSKANIRM